MPLAEKYFRREVGCEKSLASDLLAGGENGEKIF